MTPVAGYHVTVTGLQMTMPTSCCRCGAPSTKQLRTSVAVRGFGSNKTRSVDVPYCEACAARAKKIQSARTMLVLMVLAIAIVVPGLGVVAPFLPRVAIIVIPTALAVLSAVVLRQRAGETVELPWGAWLRKGTSKDSTFFCTHAGWAQQFAAANGVPAAPATYVDNVKPWILGLIVAAGVSTFISFAVRPGVYVDNGGKQPVQVWLDGKPAVVAQPTLGKGVERAKLDVPMGHHVFGWSPVGAAAPTGQTQPRKVTWMGDHLYNPGQTACYWLDVSAYGSASARGKAQGPQPLDEFYTFKSIDNWFKDNPTSISTKSSGETRTAINTMKVCEELTDHGCSVEVRKTFTTCAQKAFAADDKQAFEGCISAAARTCASAKN